MKICLIFLSLIAVVLALHEDHDHADYVIQTKEDLERYRDECTSKLSIPNDLIETYKKWNYPDDEKTHCYLKCIFEHFGVFDEKNGFYLDKIHYQLAGDQDDHTNELHSQIDDCVKESADAGDACTRAYHGAICFFSKNLPLVKENVDSK